MKYFVKNMQTGRRLPTPYERISKAEQACRRYEERAHKAMGEGPRYGLDWDETPSTVIPDDMCLS